MSWVVTWEHDLFRLTLEKEIECNVITIFSLGFLISELMYLLILLCSVQIIHGLIRCSSSSSDPAISF